jgi:hypothetical protein
LHSGGQASRLVSFPFWLRWLKSLARTTTLVLLPGLDGTEIFFRPLLAALPTWVKPLVVYGIMTIPIDHVTDNMEILRTRMKPGLTNCKKTVKIQTKKTFRMGLTAIKTPQVN